MFDNYPPGAANDPRAPYNQQDPEAVEVKVSASITLSKNFTLSIDDYEVNSWSDSERDDEGYIVRNGGNEYNFDNCNLLEALKEQEYTIPELLEILKEYAKADLEGNSHHFRNPRRIIDACDNWVVDDEYVVLG